MAMVRMRATEKMPPAQARRLEYRTRMLRADLLDGQEFEIDTANARILRKAQWAEDVTGAAPTETAASAEAPKRRGRPPKAATAAARPVPEPKRTTAPPEPEEVQDPYRDKTVSELRQMVVDRDIDLPSGYVTHDDLVKMLISGD